MVTSVGDIGIYRQSTGGQNFNSGTATNFPFNTQVRQDGDLARSDNTAIEMPAGKWLVVYNCAFEQDSGSNRSVTRSDLYLDSTALTGVYGAASGYIRRSGSHSESHQIAATIVDVASEGDALEVRVTRTDSNTGVAADVIANTSGIQVLKLDDDWAYGRYRGSTGNNFTTDSSYATLTLDATDEEDTGISRSSSSITLSNDRWFIATYSAKWTNTTNVRNGVMARLALDGTEIPGSNSYNYVRNNNGANDAVTSGFCLFKTGGTSTVLTVEGALDQHDVGAKDVDCDEVSVAIVELPSGAECAFLELDTTEDFSTTAAAVSNWNDSHGDAELDTDAFTWSSGSSSQLQVDVTDDYLVAAAFQNLRTNLTSGTRSAPRARLRFDGSTVLQYGMGDTFCRGANSNNDCRRSAMWAFALEDMTATNYVEAWVDDTTADQTDQLQTDRCAFMALRIGSVTTSPDVTLTAGKGVLAVAGKAATVVAEAPASIARHGTTYETTTTGTSPKTLAVTVPSGDSIKMEVWVGTNDNSTASHAVISGVSYEGTDLDEVLQIQTTGDAPTVSNLSLWRLDDPGAVASSGDITVTAGGACEGWVIYASFLTDAKAGDPSVIATDITDDFGDFDHQITTDADDTLCSGFVVWHDNETATVDGGDQTRVDFGGGSNMGWALGEASVESSSTTVDFFWDVFTNDYAAHGIVQWESGSDIGSQSQALTAGKGVLAVVGKTASVSAGAALSAGKGVLAVAGKAATVTATTTQALTATKGVLGLVGKAATVQATTNVAETATKGVLELAGKAATVSVSTNQALSAGKGVLSLTGQPGTVVATSTVAETAGKGVLGLVGKAATVSVAANQALTAGKGVLGLVGRPATVSLNANQALTAGKGVLGLTGQQANIGTDTALVAGKGVLGLVGRQATVVGSTNIALSAGKGVLSLVGRQATVSTATNVDLTAGKGVLGLVGRTANVSTNTALVAAKGVLGLTGRTALVSGSVGVTAGKGVISLTGHAATVTTSTAVSLSAGKGVLAFAGKMASFDATTNVTLTAGKGVLGLVGKTAGLSIHVAPTATKGVLGVVGKPASLAFSQNLTLTTRGVLAVTGQAATVSGTAALVAGKGVLGLIGRPANLTTSAALVGGKGVLGLVGKAATVDNGSGVNLIATKGVLAVVGKAATIVAGTGQVLTAGKGSLALVGKTASVVGTTNIALAAGKGVLAFSGKMASFDATTNVALSANKGTLGLVGKAASVTGATNIALSAGKGVLGLTGQSATVSAPTALVATKGTLAVVGRQATVFTSTSTNISLTADNDMPLAITGYPATVTTGLGITALSDAAFPARNYKCGPFEMGSGVYFVALESTGRRHVTVLKAASTTAVDGDWSVQDNGSLVRGDSDIESLWATRQSNKLHISTQQANGNVRYHVFDVDTDTFTIKDETVVSAGDTDFDNAPANEAVSHGLRANGDVVLTAAYNDGTLERIRCFVRSAATGTWSNIGAADGAVAATDYTNPIVIGTDSNDRVTWAFFDATGNDVDTQSLSSANALGTVTSLDPGVVTTPPYVLGPGAMVGDTVNTCYIDGDFFISNRQFTAAAAPSGITFVNDVSDAAVLGRLNTTPPFVVATLVRADTEVHLLYGRHTGEDLYHCDDATTTGGGTETEIQDAITCNRISAEHGVNGILYAYSNGDDSPIFATLSTGHATLVANKGTLAVTGKQATIDAQAQTNVAETAGKGVLGLVGKTATVSANVAAVAGKGVLGLTGHQATIDLENSTSVALTGLKGALAVTGKQATVLTSQLCFPGAMGRGRYCIGGRGGTVIRVTNLNGSGDGSFKKACETAGARNIIFDVSGEIDQTVDGDIDITNPFCTIAGETAPSPGITIRGATLKINARHVYVSHIRIRVGDDASGPTASTRDALTIVGGSQVTDIMISQCSFSWGIDENIGFESDGGAWSRVTFQCCLNGEPLQDSIHPAAVTAGAFYSLNVDEAAVTDLSVLRCLTAHSDRRHLALADGPHVLQAVNNYFYNPVQEAAVTFNNDSANTGAFQASVIGNVVDQGLDSDSTTNYVLDVASNLPTNSEIYVDDNISVSGVLWNGSTQSNNEVLSTPISMDDVDILSSSLTQATVLSCAGARPQDRDAIDTRIVADVQAGTGNVIDSQDDVGGWDDTAGTTDVKTLPDNQDQDSGDGYTNLEKWLHGLANALENAPVNVESSVGKGTLAVAGKTASVATNVNAPATKGVLAVRGLEASVIDGSNIVLIGATGHLGLVGKPASVGLDRAMTANKGTLAVVGKPATVSVVFPVAETAGKGTLEITGYDALVNQGAVTELWSDLPTSTTEVWEDVA